ncbi:S26 family signal peptidase [Streptomyces cahuitamycinicus]|uniref:S26 family signal peptidase n=1 Tax=Streptomyces cahuitamycinicus TaxID=2070367 RepID=A0A2N8TN49_9ACTN|nr:S26 family signal peptidase [Streptomyces cahuitamycinicus]PNG20446.1 S26 family signal peptidase [Streptomyces cahuitamycinicus]
MAETPSRGRSAAGLRPAIAALFGGRLVAVTVRGASMEPAYRDGDRVLVLRRREALTAGQVVVVERPDGVMRWARPPLPPGPGGMALQTRQWVIKRVAAGPGDPVPADVLPTWARGTERRVPPDRLVLLGDNADFSIDSRAVGYFPVARVLGPVLHHRPARRPGPPRT